MEENSNRNKIKVGILEGKNRTPLDLDKKYFSDIHSRYVVKKKDIEQTRLGLYTRHTWKLDKKYDIDLTKKKYTALGVDETPIILNDNDSQDVPLKGIYAHLSINELKLAINSHSTRNLYYHSELLRNGKKAQMKREGKGLTIKKTLLWGGISSNKNKLRENNGSPFLFLDIDVKKETSINKDGKVIEKGENVELYSDNGEPNAINKKVYNFIESISLITARSISGIGICSVLYVPALEKINCNRQHKAIGVAVYDAINQMENCPLKISFDENQAQFTLARTFAIQKNHNDDTYVRRDVEINKDYLEFDLDVDVIATKVDKLIAKGHDKLKKQNNKSYTALKGNEIKYSTPFDNKPLIWAKYNKDSKVSELFLNNGYYLSYANKMSKIGKKNNSILINDDKNIFTCWTSSLAGYSPFHALVQLVYDGDAKKAFSQVCEDYGVELVVSNPKYGNSEIITSEDSLYSELHYDVLDEIMPHWDDDLHFVPTYGNPSLRTPYAINEEVDASRIKLRVFDFFNINENGEMYVYQKNAYELIEDECEKKDSYHQLLKDTAFIPAIYEQTENVHKIENYLTESMIFKHCIRPINYFMSPCGSGKTSVFMGKDGIARHKKVLFIVPRTIMVSQQASTFDGDYNIIASSGEDEMDVAENVTYIKSIGNNYQKLIKKNVQCEPESCLTTYDQYCQLPTNIISNYDYVVFDEAHLLAADLSYREAINLSFRKMESTVQLQGKTKHVLLSATPTLETYIMERIYKYNFNVVRFEKFNKINPKVTVVNLSYRKAKKIQIFKRILKSIEEGKRVIIYINNKDKIREHWRELELYCHFLSIDSPTRSTISSDSKSLDSFNLIASKEKINVELLYCTEVLNVGVNISQGVEKGIDFIFDYTSNNSRATASSIVQLIYRNRLRNSHAYIFYDIYIGNKFKLFYEENIDNPIYSNKYKTSETFEILKKNGKIKKELNDKIVVFDSVNNVKFDKNISNTSVILSLMNQNEVRQSSNIESLIWLCQAHGMVIDYDFESKLRDTDTSIGFKNIFIENMLIALIELEKGAPIMIDNISASTDNHIPNEFKVVDCNLDGDWRVVKCEYHSTWENVVQIVRRTYNYISKSYSTIGRIVKVLDMVRNGSGRNPLDKALIKYKNLHQLLTADSKIISAIVSKELANTDDFRECVWTGAINSTIAEIERMFWKVVYVELSVKERKIIGGENFKNVYREYLYKETEKAANTLFTRYTKQGQIKWKTNVVLLDNVDNRKEAEVEKIFRSSGFLDFYDKMNADNEIQMLNDLIENKYDISCLDIHWVDSCEQDSDKELISINQIIDSYKNEIKKFANINLSLRAKNLYGLVDLIEEKIYLEVSKKSLYEKLVEFGITKKITTENDISMNSYRNFRERINEVKDYRFLGKIKIRDL